MKEWLKWVIGGIVGFVLLLLGFTKLRGALTDKKVTDLLEKDKVDSTTLAKEVKAIDKKEQVSQVNEAKVNQQLEDLKDKKVDETEIASFIEMMEKKSDAKKN